ncbi:MAG: 16S rRNA (adenine(1518)-N(6)/adenine(1519)-N(6))-dimethyltransferase RsmA [Pyrinomonadaceae bacterium]
MPETPKRRLPKNRFAKKSLGQNFLVNHNYISRIIDALEIKEADTVLEIGAGRGALTKELVSRARSVIAIELDRDLTPILRAEFEGDLNFKLIEGDILEIDIFEIVESVDTKHDVKLAANLPYYISTQILQRLIELSGCFERLVLMLQREVAERIAAEPGSKERGFLTVLMKRYFEIEKLFDVPPNAFRPVPKVTSSVVRLTPFKDKQNNHEAFRNLVSCGFAKKRKTIRNNLLSAPEEFKTLYRFETDELLRTAEIDKKMRAEQLSLDEWERLTSILTT